MTFPDLNPLLAAAAPPAGPGQAPPIWVNLFPFFLIMVVFYFLVMRPQQKKARLHAEALKALKPGDKVITSGGIVAIVIGVKDRTVSLRSADTKLEMLKSAVSEITEKAAGPGE